MEQKRGQNIEPWGTPEVGSQEDEEVPVTEVRQEDRSEAGRKLGECEVLEAKSGSVSREASQEGLSVPEIVDK